MTHKELIDKLFIDMTSYYSGDPKRIQHFTKVYAYAKLIGELEGLDEKLQQTLEITALVHDIGIKNAEAKYGRCDGKSQEVEGPEPARIMLTKLGLEACMINRVCYLIAHHHTYSQVDGPDYRILLEADFLVNLYEDDVTHDGIVSAYHTIFKTQSGQLLVKSMYGLK